MHNGNTVTTAKSTAIRSIGDHQVHHLVAIHFKTKTTKLYTDN